MAAFTAMAILIGFCGFFFFLICLAHKEPKAKKEFRKQADRRLTSLVQQGHIPPKLAGSKTALPVECPKCGKKKLDVYSGACLNVYCTFGQEDYYSQKWNYSQEPELKSGV